MLKGSTTGLVIMQSLAKKSGSTASMRDSHPVTPSFGWVMRNPRSCRRFEVSSPEVRCLLDIVGLPGLVERLDTGHPLAAQQSEC
jgi:hypothetical protein